MKRFKYSFINTEEQLQKMLSLTNQISSPALIFDLKKLAENYNDLRTSFDFSKIYYAIKANPSKEIIEFLNNNGSSFDAATIYEIEYLLNLGVKPERISYGHTIKKWKDIETAYEWGIRLFVTDSFDDLKNISKYAPNSNVLVRILTTGTGAEWPLSRKFGCHPAMAVELLLKAKQLGVNPYGLSFHVGSQQKDVGQWDEAIAKVKSIFDIVRASDIKLRMINMGGGLPISYHDEVPKMNFYAEHIKNYLNNNFDEMPEIIIEPGRSLVADCGIIYSNVIQVSKKGEYSMKNWVYLDVGMFNGLIETIDESIKYTVVAFSEGEYEQEVVLAGPTCDSLDVLYENTKYCLPNRIKEGDKVFILGTGAYTLSYSSINFNGIPPLSYIIF